MRREGSRNIYFQQRIPADVRRLIADGVTLAVPIGQAFAPVTLSPATRSLKLSLRTSDPAEIKIRNAKTAAYVEGIWQGLRAGIRPDCAVSLTNKQGVALSGRLYRAWGNVEGRERSVGMVRVPAEEPTPGEPVKEWK